MCVSSCETLEQAGWSTVVQIRLPVGGCGYCLRISTGELFLGVGSVLILFWVPVYRMQMIAKTFEHVRFTYFMLKIEKILDLKNKIRVSSFYSCVIAFTTQL